MSFVGSLLGSRNGNQGGAGLNYNAAAAQINTPVNQDQADWTYANAQQGIDDQAKFLAALQAQNGIGNQSNVFNQQQALADQLQGVANGTGPNPALQQLQNTTGQNVANQAALMASQRGSGANVGLLARQAAMQGANIQQQAVGQGAALQAQQQLAGLSALQQQQNMMGNLAGQQVAQQAGANQAYSNSSQNEQQNLLNAIQGANNTKVNMQSNLNSANAGIAGKSAEGQEALFGGALKGASALSGLGGTPTPQAHGGMIQHYDLGGLTMPAQQAPSLMGDDQGPQSLVGQHFSSLERTNLPSNQMSSAPMAASPQEPAMQSGANAIYQGSSDLMKAAPLLMKAAPALMKAGGPVGPNVGRVPGKASVPGDSLKNDKVPAMLSAGEIVIPRSITMNKDAGDKAKAFVEALLAKKGMKK